MPDRPTPTAPSAAGERQPGVPPFRYTARLANEIELAWQDRWAASGVHHAPNPVGDLAAGFDRAAGRPKAYILDMFPYPSGRGLHVGHPLGYIATDIFARYKRMTGFTVLHAMGYDAFGLPAEQYAVQTGTHPRITTEQNIESMRGQLRRLGLGHDDRRSVATTDVTFYRWTQWIFLQIYNSWYDERAGRARPIADLVAEFESCEREPISAANPDAKSWADLDDPTRRRVIDSWRLAYLDEQPVNWCPMLGTVLANEEVTADGRSERGNYPVYRRPLKQWVLRITAYAERLLHDLDLVDWPEPVKLMQRNWIGRSEGARLRFSIEKTGDAIEIFTTRPDTIFGATYMVLAPEHHLVSAITPEAWPKGTPESWKGASPASSPRDAVAEYRAAAAAKSDVQRQAETNEKTGVFTGSHAINPATGERVPIFIADYVLMGYGTGASMAVPGHDERDFEFAEAFDLPIRDVVYPAPIAAAAWFLAHTPDADAFPLGWELAIADFVALATGAGYDASRYPGLLDLVRLRRTPMSDDQIPVALPAIDQPGGVGERRGAVQAVWIETLGDIIALGFDRAREEFAAGGFWRTRGAPYTEPGVVVNSPPMDGLRTADAKHRAIEHLESLGAGTGAVTYKLRDWLFSRQRYWGEPFPIVFDEHDLPVALPESMLPVELPDLDNFQPEATEDPDAPPRPPLGRAGGWASVTLDLGGGPKSYRRELNTMPQWAGSCWYYLRYLDPTNEREFCDPAIERHWMLGQNSDAAGSCGGVDLYVGGVEHAVLHLLYARFWHKVLFDLGRVSTVEPFQKLYNQGYILAPAYTDSRGVYAEASEVEERDGAFFHHGEAVRREFGKMGKSLKNSVTPDEICTEFGADTLRLYEMYMGPLDQSKPWNPRDIVGMHRFLQRLWRVMIDEESGASRVADATADDATRRLLHKTIAGVRADCESLQFNTAIAKLNEFTNHMTRTFADSSCPREVAAKLILLAAPFVPHIADELWRRVGHDTPGVVLEAFPEADPALLVEDTIELAVQALGKVRCRITVPAEAGEDAIREAALADERVQQALAGKTVRKVIVVPGRLVNIVAS